MKSKQFLVIIALILFAAGIYAVQLWQTEDGAAAEAAMAAPFSFSKLLEPVTFSDSSDPAQPPSIAAEDPGRSYSVSTSSDLATDVGMAVLEAGGNAVDAAIAVAYTLAVVEPYGSGLGGSGGLLVYEMDTGTCVFYDYRAASGSAASSYDGIGVPGFVAGMDACYRDYGSIAMPDLLGPAIYYAENGFSVNSQLSYRLNSAKYQLGGYSWLYNEDGSYLTTGDTIYQPQLAEVLRAIQSEGAEVFYRGWIAEDIAEKTSLALEDLDHYQVYKRDAVQGYFEGYTVYSANAPLSGVTLIQMLEMADELDLANPAEDPRTYLSQLKQITAAAYGIRYSTIGDHSFYEIDESELVSRAYILKLLGLGFADEDYDQDYESVETTSFSIVDSNGLVVSCTNTLTQSWGSRLAVDGIFMNNTNNNFSSSGINKYEPGKRSRTFTAPTIITGDNGYVLAVGTPGGNNIPSRLFSIIVDILKYGEDPQASIFKTGILYRNGVLILELDENNTTWFDTSGVAERIVWKPRGIWWGSISLAGYSDELGAFSAYDPRRGTTRSGVFHS